MRHYLKFILCLTFLAIQALGCAMPSDYVKLQTYTPDKPHKKPGNGITIYIPKAVDNRSEDRPELVGQKGSWPTRGDIVLTGRRLTDIYTDSVTECLQSYGYIVKPADDLDSIPKAGGQPKALLVSIEEFWCKFSVVSVGGPPIAYLTTHSKLIIDIIDPETGLVLWKRKITAKDRPFFILWGGAAIYEKSLNDTLAKTMRKFEEDMSSDDFKKALMDGGVIQTQTPPAPQTAPATTQAPSSAQ